MAKTIIVSNRLPISIVKNDGELEYKPSAGGLATGLGSIYKEGDNIWLGWPGIYINSTKEKEVVTKELTKESMRPVFLKEQDIKLFYEGFSNSTIWPLFHYFPQYCQYSDTYWDAYVKVNKMFCKEILKYAKEDDIIWVHDYQLLLLPEMIRKELPNASIGYFNHIPFPSYEVFRLLPWRKQLLEGVLGADMIGFHTYDDMRHFLSAVSRIVGVDHEMGHLKFHGRIITVDALPMGIDYDKFANAAVSKDTQKEVKQFYRSLRSQRLILSIDRLDYSKGIPQRLHAFDKFLERYPDYQGKVSLILLVVPSRDNVDTYIKLKEELELLVGRINGKYSMLDWTPIHYFYRSLPFSKLTALYTMADVALVTPLRDGMNLVCKEFIASKLDKTGVLILSEMAGSAKELSEALLVNPNDQNQMVESIHRALTMPEEEQEARNIDMQSKLQRYNIFQWVDNFMDRLKYTKEQQKKHVAKHITPESEKEIIKAYKKAKKRLLLLDYDGTLTGFHVIPGEAKPDEELLSIIKKLSKEKDTEVVVISGRDRQTLEDWLGHLPIEFVAEHGVWMKEKNGNWQMTEDLMQNWMAEIKPILDLYVDRTPGSFIEEKDYSLVWHYRKAEAGLGDLRGRELISNLQYLTSNMDIHIMEGNKVIEIKNAGIHKGKAALKFINRSHPDFVIALGDDYTDEDTFKVIPDDQYSVKVGFTATDAKYNIKSPVEVRQLLAQLADVKKKVKA